MLNLQPFCTLRMFLCQLARGEGRGSNIQSIAGGGLMLPSRPPQAYSYYDIGSFFKQNCANKFEFQFGTNNKCIWDNLLAALSSSISGLKALFVWPSMNVNVVHVVCHIYEALAIDTFF